MRELKFRAWDIKREEIIYVNGLQFNNDGLKQVRLYRGAYQIRMAKNIVLMQYTGLKDKNEKEIYESDYLGDWCVFRGSGKYILHNISTGDIIDCDETNTINKEINGNSYETPREHKAMASDL